MSKEDWRINLRKEVYQYWMENFDPDRDDSGFQVFYCPAKTDASILILGLNLGGDESAFRNKRERFEAEDFSLPQKHDYLDESPPKIGKETLKVMGEEAVSHSAKTNIYFFRSGDEDELESRLRNQGSLSKKEIEQQCRLWVRKFVDKIDPDLIICEGTKSVFNPVTKYILDDVTYLDSIREEAGINRRIVCTAQTTNRYVVGFPHPTGQGSTPALFQNNVEIIKEEVQNAITEYA
jgi:hypothetical protein